MSTVKAAPHSIRGIIAMRPGLTQKALAAEVGITPYWMSQIVLGRQRPSAGLKQRLADAIDVPVEILFRADAP